MAITFDDITATVVDQPTRSAPAGAPPPAPRPVDDRRRLDDLLRQRLERAARLAAD